MTIHPPIHQRLQQPLPDSVIKRSLYCCRAASPQGISGERRHGSSSYCYATNYSGAYRLNGLSFLSKISWTASAIIRANSKIIGYASPVAAGYTPATQYFRAVRRQRRAWESLARGDPGTLKLMVDLCKGELFFELHHLNDDPQEERNLCRRAPRSGRDGAGCAGGPYGGHLTLAQADLADFPGRRAAALGG